MVGEVELSQIDLRYESYRIKNAGLEEKLLGSIAQGGIEEPLEGVEVHPVSILLNGFKRYRCARNLQMSMVPYTAVGTDGVMATMNLLRLSNNQALNLLEQRSQPYCG